MAEDHFETPLRHLGVLMAGYFSLSLVICVVGPHMRCANFSYGHEVSVLID